MKRVFSWANKFATVRLDKTDDGKFQVTVKQQGQPDVVRAPTDEYDAKFQFEMYIKQIKGDK